MLKKTKLFQTNIKSIDESALTVDVIFSTEDEDRDGEIVVQSGWDFEDYEKNPVVLWGHNPFEPPVGKTLDIEVQADKSIAKIQFAKDDDESMRLFNLVKQGILKTVSAGFINILQEGNRLLENKLLEISWVTIPANQNAITLAYEGGMISKDDKNYLSKKYKKELDYLETADHKLFDDDSNYIYDKDCISCIKCQDQHDKIGVDGDNKNKGDTMDEAKVAELVKESIAEAIKPMDDKLDALKTDVETVTTAQTEAKETLSKLEANAPIKEAGADDVDEEVDLEDLSALLDETE